MYLRLVKRRFLLFWIVLYTLGAWFSTGFHHFDEHFQIIEFAQYKLGLNTPEELTWEFHERMRPALQPALATAGLSIMRALGLENPFYQLFIFRWLTALLSLAAALFFYQRMAPSLADRYKVWFWWLNLGFWALVFSRLRFSSEAWSALAMLVGLVLVSNESRNDKLYLGGLVLGLAFVLRFQAGAFVAGIGLWMLLIQRNTFWGLASSFTGIVTAVAMGAVVDRWFYNEWVFTPWHYLDLNILQDRVSNFGVSPWYYYFTEFLAFGVPPFSVVLLVLVLLYPIFYPKSSVSWSVLPFVALHIAVGHKEARFLFPALAFVPWMVVASIPPLLERWPKLAPVFGKTSRGLFVVGNTLALMVILFKPAEANMQLYRWLHSHYAGQKVLLLGLNDIPYEHENLQVKFYRDTLWHRQRFELDSMLPSTPFEERLLVVNHALTFDSTKFKRLAGEELYRDMPAALAQLEYNGWYRRSDKWHVYRLKSSE